MLTYLLRYLESCAKSTIRRVLYSLYMINLGGVMVRCPLQVALACYLENRKTLYNVSLVHSQCFPFFFVQNAQNGFYCLSLPTCI
jgi:hypothetical protein